MADLLARLLAQLHRVDDGLAKLTGHRHRSAGIIVLLGLCMCVMSLLYALYVRFRAAPRRQRRAAPGNAAAPHRDGPGAVPIRVAVWPTVMSRGQVGPAATLLAGLKDALAAELGRAVHLEVVAVCMSAAALGDATAVSELAARCGLGARLLLLDTLHDPPEGAWISVGRVQDVKGVARRVDGVICAGAPDAALRGARWKHIWRL